jgi:hypothetical protein
MPRRRATLKSIASGLLGSFLSRNNDIRGYWAIGLLHAHAESSRVSVVTVSLCPAPSSEEAAVVLEVGSKYGERLFSSLAKHQIASQVVRSASIVIEFNSMAVLARALVAGERPLKATLRLVTEENKEVITQAYSSSWPHNPRREHRSARA